MSIETNKLSKKQKLAYDIIKKGENLFISGMAGTGKCLALNTPIIMYNGEVKMVQDIVKGELIMGDDSKERKVLSTTKGKDIMYKVKLLGTGTLGFKDDEYIVNSSHILTFKSIKIILFDEINRNYVLKWGHISGEVKTISFKTMKEAKLYSDKIPDVIDLPIKKCLNKDKSWNNYFHGFYNSINFKENLLHVDPYYMGAYLGRKIGNKKEYSINLPKFYKFTKSYLHIPLEYKSNLEKHRLALLAGIIDECNVIDFGKDYYTISCDISSCKQLIHDIYFVSKSLGFHVYKKYNNKCFIIIIRGNIFNIPITNEKYNSTEKYNMRFGITSRYKSNMKMSFPVKIEKLDENDYYGFEIDGNKRFLLGNFIVTHNTEVLKIYIKENYNGKNMGITSTTGISALNFGGTTLHSFLGIGLGNGTVDELVKKVKGNFSIKARWKNIQILIIDEVSMLSPILFDKLESVARCVRNIDKPFGGIQLILSGDFLQLPVVNSDKFCFESDKWNECMPNIIYLTEIMRQKEVEFQKCLNSVRVGEVTEQARELLDSRIGIKLKNNYGIKPTRLYTTNNCVDYINDKEMDELYEKGAEFYEYEIDITLSNILKRKKNNSYILDKFMKDCPAKKNLQLCKGAQVMLLYNKDVVGGLVNGSRGIIVNFIDDIPVVKFLNGQEVVINYHTWTLEENKKILLEVTQIPLKPAYALTAHKSQGSTLDYVEVDLVNCFEYGQAYVMLSRVKNSEGLSIIDIDYNGINAHPKAIKFYLDHFINDEDISIGPSDENIQNIKVKRSRKNALLLLKSEN